MHVIGTAGHVDHGKSTLVEALTGTHPDRLKEEREREMTIDLGFAWLNLPDGNEVGIIDVPGHRDFIENMLAGIGGIDAALFVVAADEGVMPQTREHLSIIDLLQVQGGVIAVTKIDLLEPESRDEWLELLAEDLRKLFASTVLSSAPILPVSARTGEGISALKNAISACLAEKPPRPDLGKPRLPVDRAFTISGFGTIVTGTLSDGQLQLGEEVQILPSNKKGRIRGLQTHKQKEEIAVPGSRTAVNISGINLDEVQRGNVITHPGDYQPTRRLDASIRLLNDASQPLQHNMHVKLFIGSTEIMARLRLLGSEMLRPGEEGWLQLELEQPVVAVRGDRFILRRPSPGETLGGGRILDPGPRSRHKRFAEETISQLEALAQGTPQEILLQAVISSGIAPWNEVLSRSSLPEDTARQALEALVSSGQVHILDQTTTAEEGKSLPVTVQRETNLTSRGMWEQIITRVTQEVGAYHATYPLRRGIPREELKSRLRFQTFSPVKGSASNKIDLSARIFIDTVRKLADEGAIRETGTYICLPGHSIHLTQSQQSQVEKLIRRFDQSPYSPPGIKEIQAEVGEELYNALVESGVLLPMHSGGPVVEVAFRKEDFDRMVVELRGLFEINKTLTAAQVRDHFNTSRRYVLAFLEHLDALGITIRVGDARRLK